MPGVTDQDIKVSMGGYSDWEQVVDVNTTTLLVNLTRKTLTLTVDLYDSDTLSPHHRCKHHGYRRECIPDETDRCVRCCHIRCDRSNPLFCGYLCPQLQGIQRCC